MTHDTREEIREAYNQGGGEQYDELREQHPRGALLTRRDLDIFRRLLPPYRKDMSVLEVGAGTGRFTFEALDHGYRLIATDINEPQLEQLRKKLRQRDLEDRCQARTEDIFSLSFADEQFDLVICLHVIPRLITVEDQTSAVRELCRVVKPGGMLLFNFRNANSPYRLVYRGPAATAANFDAVLGEFGFRIERRLGKHLLNGSLLDRLPTWTWPAADALDRALEIVPPAIAWDIFVLSRRDKTH